MHKQSGPKRVVILGGGFAGVYTARQLLKKARPGEITVDLVSMDNFMAFQPLLPEVISGSVGIADTATPIRQILPGATIHLREVESVDVENRRVICSAGFQPHLLELNYDHLVIALGNVCNFQGMTGLAEHAMPFKNLADAITLRNHIIRIMEEEDCEKSEAFRRELLTFVVGGGGFSGVEVIAQIHGLIWRARRNYPNINMDECRFVLVHSQDRILPEVAAKLGHYAEKQLRKRNIEILLGCRLRSATPRSAILADGREIRTRTLVSTVPSQPHPVVEALIRQQGWQQSTPDGRRRPMVRLPDTSMLQMEGFSDVWAVGDCAQVPLPIKSGEPQAYAPPTAQHASREAVTCARNILADIRGEKGKAFNFFGIGALASLGRRRGVAQILGVCISGFPAWVLWRLVHLGKLPGVYRKFRVGLSWLFDFIFPSDIIQLSLKQSGGIRQEHYETGETVFEQGDVGDRVYVLIKGEVEVMRHENDQVCRLAQLHSGDIFGEMAVLHCAPRNATIRCSEPSEVLSIERHQFDTLIHCLNDLGSSVRATAESRSNCNDKTDV
ncbi:MAG: FAD-dependent oxidoreductase [Mariprofundus sp.]|nr:FAD-dependent oxidoreductase [Mariprofundus sp.]